MTSPPALASSWCPTCREYTIQTVGRPSAPHYPAVKPDATKLVRAVEDALTGICWRDDAQIVNQDVRKRYADTGSARVEIAITSLSRLASGDAA